MIDYINPTTLKQHIKSFDKGGMVMPSDVEQDLLDFQTELENPNLSESEKQSFQRAIEAIINKYPQQIDDDKLTSDAESVNMLTKGNWFAKHPQKLLGNLVVDNDRYGKEIKILKGSLSVLDQIEVSSDLMQLAKNVNIAVTSIQNTIEENIQKPEINEFVSEIIKKSNTSIGKKAVTKKKQKEDSVNSDYTTKAANIQTYDQIFEKLNKSISKEELRAYVWYKEQIGQRLSLEWYKMAFGEEQPYKFIDEAQVKKWVQNGLLFYYDGELLPLPLYASGNVYEKLNRVVKSGDNSGADIETIKKKYGESALQKHLEVLNEAFNKVYSNRLVITGNTDENSLILKPISKFAKSFQIQNTESFEQFRWWASGKKANEGKPDFSKIDGREYQKSVFQSLSLTDAFCYWMITFRNKLEFKGNITYDDIIYFYINKRTKQAPSYLSEAQKAEFQANLERTKAKAAMEGNRLFMQFLYEELNINQKVAVETQWNASFNNYLTPDYKKIPVAFNVTNNFFGEEPFVIKDEKREAVSFLFNEGSGCLAYDVGVGKSISAIFTMEQFLVAGYCKRPFVVIPNQTYRQWLAEIKNALPHRKVNGLFNLGADYMDEVLDENNNVMMVEEGSITVLTYEGFERIGFNDITQSQLMSSLYDILNQGGADQLMSEKKRAGFYEKLQSLVGKGLKGTNVEIESLGFDFVCFDEAHALKKVFTSVKGEVEEGEKKARKSYSLQAGLPSNTALKGFMISNYILKNNNFRNVVLLTATPFTNSPLEVYSMLSLVAYHHLTKLGIVNINDFFDNYIDVSTELVINHKLQPQYKQIVKGFNNLPSLQKIIFRFFNYKDGTDVGVVRPNKIVIPYLKKLVNGTVVNIPDAEQVTCNIEMSNVQKAYMKDIVMYAEGKSELRKGIATEAEYIKGENDLEDEDAEVLDDDSLSDSEKSGVRALRAMNFSRNLALSPYLYEYNSLGEPNYKDYISTSPKLQYVMECVRSVKKYHEDNNEPVSGQVIYMDRGLKYFGLIKDYLVYEIGFKPHEIGEISGSMNPDKKRMVQDGFNGERYNPKTKETEPLDDKDRIKVLLGSGSIKEGMNLQKKSTVLYNCFLDWNPTDIIQLEGRIWRQKNQFANVRIVNPLVIDSIDIFMFQKLEEKTARINTIWSNNGKSVFKIEELDPEELKYALVKDPRVIAKIEVESKTTKLQDEINAMKVINDRLKNYVEAVEEIDNRKEDIDEKLSEFAKSKLSLDFNAKISYLTGVFKSDMPKDGDGKVMLGWYDRKYFNTDDDVKEKYKGMEISPYEQPTTPYWWSDVIESKRLIEKENRDLLKPRNIKENKVREYIDSSENRKKEIEKEIEFLKSDTYVDKRSAEIVKKREETKFEIKPIPKLITEFERLNYLLSIKMAKAEKKKEPFKYDKTIFLDDKGVAKIDDATIKMLTEGIGTLPQTKDLNLDEEGNYTTDRLLLHYEIINGIKRNLNCIQRDKPIAILTGGSPASGKSTFLKRYAPYLLSEELLKIDADEIRAKLPEYEGWNAAVTHSETKDIVNTLLTDQTIGVPCMFDVIYDGTMNNSRNYLPLIGLLKRLGYQVFIVYMDNVPYDVVKERMLKRYQTSGRFVPVEVIDDFYAKGKAAINELKTKVDGYMIIDATSSNYDIIEQGGMKLPSERNYGQLGERVKTADIVDKMIEATKILIHE